MENFLQQEVDLLGRDILRNFDLDLKIGNFNQPFERTFTDFLNKTVFFYSFKNLGTSL